MRRGRCSASMALPPRGAGICFWRLICQRSLLGLYLTNILVDVISNILIGLLFYDYTTNQDGVSDAPLALYVTAMTRGGSIQSTLYVCLSALFVFVVCLARASLSCVLCLRLVLHVVTKPNLTCHTRPLVYGLTYNATVLGLFDDTFQSNVTNFFQCAPGVVPREVNRMT